MESRVCGFSAWTQATLWPQRSRAHGLTCRTFARACRATNAMGTSTIEVTGRIKEHQLHRSKAGIALQIKHFGRNRGHSNTSSRSVIAYIPLTGAQDSFAEKSIIPRGRFKWQKPNSRETRWQKLREFRFPHQSRSCILREGRTCWCGRQEKSRDLYSHLLEF